MKLWRHLSALALALAAGSASATVLYKWVTVDPSPTITNATGTLELSDAAFAAGGLEAFWGPGNYSPPLDDFIIFQLTYSTPTGFGGSGSLQSDLRYRAIPEATVAVDLNVLDGLLTGRLSVECHGYCDDGLIRMSSNANGLWIISELYGPGIQGNCRIPGCGGATGYWVKVPEPPALLLLSIGLVTLIARRRRKT